MSIINKLKDKLNKKTIEPSIYNFEYYNLSNSTNVEHIEYPTFVRPNSMSHNDALIVLSYYRDIVYKLHNSLTKNSVKILNELLDSIGFAHIDTDERSTTLCITGADTKDVDRLISDKSIWYTPGVRTSHVKSIYKKAGLLLPDISKINQEIIELM